MTRWKAIFRIKYAAYHSYYTAVGLISAPLTRFKMIFCHASVACGFHEPVDSDKIDSYFLPVAHILMDAI